MQGFKFTIWSYDQKKKKMSKQLIIFEWNIYPLGKGNAVNRFF